METNWHDIVPWFRETLGLGPETTTRILLTVVVGLLLWLTRRMLIRTVEQRLDDVHQRYRWRKATTYLASFVALAVVARVWLEGIGSLTTMLGLISAGVAIALKDPLVNLAGWVFIMWRQPFGVGDRIQVGNAVAGDVIDQRVFAFTLLEIGNWVHADQSTGRVIHVPNGRVFTETVANYSKGFRYIWEEIAVMVTFESNWREAKRILTEIVKNRSEHLSERAEKQLRDASRKFMIFYTKLTPIVYTSVEDSGVTLTLRFLTEPHARRGRGQAIWEDILEAFGERQDIDFAYPTQRMYINSREGKRDTRPKEMAFATPPDPSDGFFD
jgi:small-conductance mechanosensitive channel